MVRGKRKDTCSKCNGNLEASRKNTNQRYCVSCHAEEMRTYRAKKKLEYQLLCERVKYLEALCFPNTL